MGKLNLTRRAFTKLAAVTGAAVACTAAAPNAALAEDAGAAARGDDVKRVRTCCRGCGKMECGVWVTVQNGRVVKVEGDQSSFQSSGNCCGKSQSSIQAAYHPDRLHYPMKRTNPKKGVGIDPGGGEEISWDEAYDPHLGEAGRAEAEEQARHRVRADHEHHLVDRLHELAGQQRQHSYPVQGRYLRSAHASHFGSADRLRQRASRLRALQVPHAVRHASGRGHASWHQHHGEGVRRRARERLQAGELRPAYVGRGREGRRVGAHSPRNRCRGGARHGEPAGERVRPVRQGVPCRAHERAVAG